MTTRHPLKWLRGIVLELAGVALIIWLATGLPGVPENTSVPGRTELPGNWPHTVSSAVSLPAAPTAWPWSRAAERSPATARPFAHSFGPPAEQRIPYTQTHLEPAGQALLSLVEDAAAHLLRDLTEAGTTNGDIAGTEAAKYQSDRSRP